MGDMKEVINFGRMWVMSDSVGILSNDERPQLVPSPQ